MVGIVEDMVLSNVQTGSSSQKYQCYILVVKFLLIRPNILDITEDVAGEETGSRTIGISDRHGKTLYSFWRKKDRFWPVQQSSTSEIR